jgi:putative transposase
VNGRKRHLLVDTQGFVLKVVVSAADGQDRDGACLVAHAVQLYGPALPRLAVVWADAGYSGQLVDDLRRHMGWRLEVVQRPDTPPRGTFAVQPHRGIVERTFSWGGGRRRLSKDYEYQVESSEALIYVGMSHRSHRLLRRLGRLTRRAHPLSSPAG